MKECFQWLSPLRAFVEHIADFGCWGGSEPFALLWTLDAAEVVVIEKARANLAKFEEELEKLEVTTPSALVERNIQTVVADMSSRIPALTPDYFDLAFCENVLYYMASDPTAVQAAVNEMVRVTKIGGWVIAVEPKFGAQFETVEQNIFGVKLTVPQQISEPKDQYLRQNWRGKRKSD